jgi:uncharacterized integral membrane protein (TIGR00698 family)
MNRFKLVPGLLLAAAIGGASIELAKLPWLQSHGMGALTLAILLGMIAGNTLYVRLVGQAAGGVAFAKQRLLRFGIVLYGLRLTLQDIGGVGLLGVAIDVLMLCTTFALAWWAGTRLFKLDRNTAMLIGAGSSICGAAAVMATEPVVHGRAAEVMVAVSTVVVFGTLAMFLYPMLFHLAEHHPTFAMTPTAYGIFAGSTIHEVAQVVVAGRAVGEVAGNAAVITKMVRVMLLAPFLILLSTYLSRRSTRTAAGTGERITIPWFALGFLAVVALNSLQILPRSAVHAALDGDTLLLATAMAALGLTTHVSAIREAGLRPLALATLLFAWLTLGGAAINAGMGVLLR